MTDVTDLNQRREEKQTEKKIDEAVDQLKGLDFNGAMATMMNEKFVAMAQHVDKHMPPTHLLSNGTVAMIFSGLLQSLLTAMPLEEAKIYLSNMVDWLHYSFVSQNGYEPFHPAEVCSHVQPDLIPLPGSVLHDAVRALELAAVGGDRRADAALIAVREALGGAQAVQALHEEYPTLT